MQACMTIVGTRVSPPRVLLLGTCTGRDGWRPSPGRELDAEASDGAAPGETEERAQGGLQVARATGQVARCCDPAPRPRKPALIRYRRRRGPGCAGRRECRDLPA